MTGQRSTRNPKRRCKYETELEGEVLEFDPVKEDWYIACCDCSLVHKHDFEIVDKSGAPIKGARVRWISYRDNRATGQLRRWRDGNGKRGD